MESGGMSGTPALPGIRARLIEGRENWVREGDIHCPTGLCTLIFPSPLLDSGTPTTAIGITQLFSLPPLP